jgi:hypothetical protein
MAPDLSRPHFEIHAHRLTLSSDLLLLPPDPPHSKLSFIKTFSTILKQGHHQNRDTIKKPPSGSIGLDLFINPLFHEIFYYPIMESIFLLQTIHIFLKELIPRPQGFALVGLSI